MSNIMLRHQEKMELLGRLSIPTKNLSTEDNDDFVSKFSNMFKQQFIAINDFFKGDNDIEFAINEKLSIGARELIDMRIKIKSFKNKDLSAAYVAKIPVTLGLKKDIYSTLLEIENGYSVIKGKVYDVINETDDIVSNFISDLHYKKRLIVPKHKFDPVEMTDHLNTSINNVIDHKSTIDRKSVKDLIGNLENLESAILKINDIGDITNIENLKKINKATSKLGDKIDVLTSMLEQNEDVSRSVIIDIAERVEYTAKLITSVTTLIFIMNQIVDTTKHTIKAIDKYKN